jgi:protein O-GlcNAc transferase
MASDRRRAQLIAAFERDRPALTAELARLYLAEEPDDRSALLIYAEALTALARYELARTAAERALALAAPGEPARRASALRVLGRIHEAQAALPEAERYYREAIAAEPDHASAYLYLGGMLARRGRLDEAEPLHRRATECPDGAVDEAVLNLGLVQRARGDYVAALASLREAVRRDPTDGTAQHALADVEAVLFGFPAPEA